MRRQSVSRARHMLIPLKGAFMSLSASVMPDTQEEMMSPVKRVALANTGHMHTLLGQTVLMTSRLVQVTVGMALLKKPNYGAIWIRTALGLPNPNPCSLLLHCATSCDHDLAPGCMTGVVTVRTGESAARKRAWW